eukprot:1162098-Pelagomonas_calceolata.AAC.10
MPHSAALAAAGPGVHSLFVSCLSYCCCCLVGVMQVQVQPRPPAWKADGNELPLITLKKAVPPS